MKIYANGFGHMTKVVAMPICEILFNNLQNQKANDLGIWYVVFGM